VIDLENKQEISKEIIQILTKNNMKIGEAQELLQSVIEDITYESFVRKLDT
jgi:hypothetical protein